MSGRARVVAIAVAQAKAASGALRGLQRPGRAGELSHARAALARAEQALSDLHAGAGAYAGTESGRAVSDLARARVALTRAKRAAEHGFRWRERRAATKESVSVAAQCADAEGRWEAHVAPEVARLEAVIFTARQDVDHLVADQEREAARWGRLTERGRRAGRAADRFGVGLAVYRKALDEGQTGTAALGRRPVRPAPYMAPVHIQPPAERGFGPGI